MFFQTLLSSIARFAYKRWKVNVLIVLLIVGAAPPLLKNLKFESFTSSLEVAEDSLARVYRENLNRFGESSPVVILLDYAGVSAAVVNRLTDELTSRLAAWPSVAYVEAKVLDFTKPSAAAVLFRAALFNSGPEAVSKFTAKMGSEAMREELKRTRKRLLTIEDPLLRDLAAADVLNVREIVRPFFEVRLMNLRFSRLGEYIDAAEQNVRLVFIQPTKPAEDADFSIGFIRRLDQLIEELTRTIPGADTIRHRYTGKHALSAETVNLLKKEMQLVTLLASALVFSLVVAAFRKFRIILISFMPIVISLVAILILARFFFNPLNYVALSFASIILGLGIDVTIHLAVRFFQFVKKGNSMEEAVRLTIADCGPPLSINISTTAAAFFCLAISDYKPVSQFGLLTALGLFITLAVSFLLFPTMVRILWPRKPAQIRWPDFKWLPRKIHTFSLSRPWTAIGVALLATGGSLFFARQFSFEMDMMKLMPKKLETLNNARETSRLFGASFISSLELTIEGKDYADSMRAQKALDEKLLQLVAEGKIAGFQSPSLFLPWNVEPRDPAGESGLAVHAIGAEVSANREVFLKLLEELRFKKSQEHEIYYQILEKAFSYPRDPIQLLQAAGKVLPQLKKFATVDSGRFYLQTYVWPENDLEDMAVVKDIDREFQDFGLPDGIVLRRTSTFQVYEEINQSIRSDFYRVSLLSFLVIVGIIFIFFRRLSDLVVCLIPVAAAVTATLGFIVFARITFTPAEIGVTALILGIGIDYAVHIVARTRADKARSILEVMPEIGQAIILAALTTIAGFASLMLTTSIVTFTLGAVISFGIFACLFFTFLMVPAIHKLLRRR